MTKEDILIAVMEEFNEYGIRFTMEGLAKRLQVSKKTIYQYYGDKESLFLEAVNECFYEIKKSEAQIMNDPNLGLIDKIHRVIIVLPEKYKAVNFQKIYCLSTTHPKLFSIIKDRIESDWEPTLNLLKQAIEQGLIYPVDLVILKTMISASIEAFLMNDVLDKNQIAYTKALEDMITIIMNGIVVRQETNRLGNK